MPGQRLRGAAAQVICEGTIAPDARVRETAFECLVKIAANYYEKLPAYMQDIFTLTHRAAKEDEEDVGKQAVEFWCTICEEELDLQEARPRARRPGSCAPCTQCAHRASYVLGGATTGTEPVPPYFSVGARKALLTRRAPYGGQPSTQNLQRTVMCD